MYWKGIVFPIIVKMRAIDIFTTLLIAGIWDPAVTRALSSSTEELMRKIQELENVPDLTTSDEGRSKIAEIYRMVGEKCSENGGSDAFDNLATDFKNFMKCLQSELDMQQLEAEIGNAQSSGNWKPVFNRICPKFPALTKCGRPVTESIKSCLDPEERSHVETIQIIVEFLLVLSCHDGGDEAASFVATGGFQCLSSKDESLAVCVTESFRGALRPVDASLPESLSALHLDENECEDVEKFRTCSVPVFRGCENPESANAVDALFTSFQKLASCNRVNTPTGVSAPLDKNTNSGTIGVVNVLLITTAMIMSFRL